MKKILVPCDFSAPAQEAYKFAVAIAAQSKGEIHVLYIMDLTFLRGSPTLSYSYAFNLDFLNQMEKEAEEKFNTMWRRYTPLALPVKFRHHLGTLLPDVDTYIRENGIDLVLMGTHGEGHTPWGSNTTKMVQHASVPVFAIRKEPGKVIKNIVVPVIPEEPDEHFCTEVKKLQNFFDARIHLVWINTPGVFKTDSDSRRDLQQFANDAEFSNYTVNIRSDYNIQDGIYRFTKEIDADMIAMATHAWKGLVHYFAGSIAEDIVDHVNVPVWTCTLK